MNYKQLNKVKDIKFVNCYKYVQEQISWVLQSLRCSQIEIQGRSRIQRLVSCCWLISLLIFWSTRCSQGFEPGRTRITQTGIQRTWWRWDRTWQCSILRKGRIWFCFRLPRPFGKDEVHWSTQRTKSRFWGNWNHTMMRTSNWKWKKNDIDLGFMLKLSSC